MQSAFANPEGFHLVGGDAKAPVSSGNLLEVHAGKRAIINWDSFSIANPEVTRFIQTDSSSVVLNRVMGGSASEILGALEANGTVLLINSKGVIFGENSRIETGGFIASTFDILDDAFLQGSDLLFQGDSDSAIINLGTIKAAEGDVILIAHRIRNDGTIQAPQGTVHMALGHEVLLQPTSGKVLIRPGAKKMYSEDEGYGIEHSGSIKALAAELKADPNIYGRAIKDTGIIEARGVVEKDGHVYLVAESGMVEVSGTVAAKNQDKGGTIHILGDQVGIVEKAYLDASDYHGGGEILLGGDDSGANPEISNASYLLFGPEAVATVDSLIEGSAGKVILFSEKGTGFYGNVYANAGPLGGDGGYVEVSGREYLDFSGQTFFGHPLGKAGTLYIDPIDVVITTTQPTSTCADNLTNFSNVVAGCANMSPTYINTTQLATTLVTNTVVLVIDTNISGGFNGDITLDTSSALSWNSPSALVLSAAGNININNLITPNSGGQTPVAESNGIGLTLNAVGDVNISTSISTLVGISNPGTNSNIAISCDNLNITSLPSSGVINIAQTNSGNISIDAAGDVTFTRPSFNGGDQAIITTNGSLDLSCSNLSILITSSANATISIGNSTANASTIDVANAITFGGASQSGTAQILASGTSPVNVSCTTWTADPGGSSGKTVGVSTVGPLNINALNSGASILFTSGISSAISTAQIVSSSDKVTINIPSGNLTLGTNGPNAGISQISGNSVEINAGGLDVQGRFSTSTVQAQIISVGDIDLTIGSGGLGLEGSSSVVSSIQCTGSGNITIDALDGAIMQLSGLGSGAGAAIITTTSGDITINATETGTNVLVGLGNLTTNTQIYTSNGGSINMNLERGQVFLGNSSSSINLSGDSSIYTNAGGEINISARNILVNSSLNSVGGTHANASIYTNASNSPITLNVTEGISILSRGTTTADSIASIYTMGSSGSPITITTGNLLMNAGTSNLTTNSYVNLSTVAGDILINTVIPPGGISRNINLIGGAGTNSYAQIMTGSGNITIQGQSSPGQSIMNLMGGSGTNSYAQILPGTSGSISINTGSLNLVGGTSPTSGFAKVYTQNPNQIIGITSNLILSTTTGAISLSANASPATTGDNSAAVQTTATTGTNPITLSCSTLSLTGAQTGTSSGNSFATVSTNSTAESDITITATSSVVLTGGATDNSYASITTGVAGSLGNITIQGAVPGTGTANVSLRGGSGNISYASILPGTGATGSSESISIEAASLALQGGTSPNMGYASIYTLGANQPVQIATPLTGSISGSISLTGSASSSPGTGDNSANIYTNSTTGTNPITLTCISLSLTGAQSGAGTGNSYAEISTGSTSASDITITASTKINLLGGITNNSYASIATDGSAGSVGNIIIQGVSPGIGTASCSLQGGSGLTSYAIISTGTGSNSSIDLDVGSLMLAGGNSTNGSGVSYAKVYTQGTNETITINASANNGAISLVGGDGPGDNSAAIQTTATTGTNSITLTSSILSLSGSQMGTSSGNSFAVVSTNSTNPSPITINAKSTVSLQGGVTNLSYASITTGPGGGSITIQGLTPFLPTPNVSLVGESGNSAYAQIVPGTGGSSSVSIYCASLALDGGTSPTSGYAIINTQGNNEPISVVCIGEISLTGGSGAGDNSASIQATSSSGANPITLTTIDLSLSGPETGTSSGNSSATISTNNSAITINATDSVSLTGGGTDNSFALVTTTSGPSITIQGPTPGSGSADITMDGGSGLNSYAQIFLPTSSGMINIYGGSLAMQGGSSTGNGYALINATGDNSTIGITCTSGLGTISLEGGTGPSPGFNYASIQTTSSTGNNSITTDSTNLSLIGGPLSTGIGFAEIATVEGDITITATGVINLEGGAGSTSYAQIYTSNSGEIQILGDSDITLQGGSGSTDAHASIHTTASSGTNPISISCSDLALSGVQIAGSGLGFATIATIQDPITITASGSVTLTGGDTGSSFASIQTATSGGITIQGPTTPGTEDISLNGGSGSSAFAEISSAGSTGFVVIDANSLSLSGGTSSTNGFATITTSGTGNSGTPIDISIVEAISLTGGAGPGDNSASIDSTSSTANTLSISCASLSLTGSQIEPSSGDSTASIFGTNSTIDITATETIDLLGGVAGADNSSATITTGAGPITISGSSNISLQGGSGTSSYVQIAPAAGSSLSITADSLSLAGGTSGTSGYAAVQTLGPSDTVSITCTTGSGEVSLLGGAGTTGVSINSALIQTQTSSLANSITIDCNSLSLSGEDAGPAAGLSFALISAFASDIEITVSQTIRLAGGLGDVSYADITTVNSGNIQILGASSILLQGGSGVNSEARIATGVTTAGLGTISITADSLQLIGGDSPSPDNGRASIDTSGSGSTITIACTAGSGAVSLTGGPGSGNNYAVIETLATSGVNTITLSSQSLSLAGGGSPGTSYALIETENSEIDLFIAGPISMKGGDGDTTYASILTVLGGDIIIQGATVGAPSGAIIMQGGSGTDSEARITTGYTSGTGNISITAASLSLTGGAGSGTDDAIIATGPSANGSTLDLSLTGNLGLFGGSASGPNNNALIQTTALTAPIMVSCSDLTIEGSHTTGANNASASISAIDGNIMAIVFGNLLVQGGDAVSTTASLYQLTGTMAIAAGGSVTVQGGTGTDAFAQIGVYSSPTSSVPIAFTNIGGNLTVAGGSAGTGNYALIGNGSPFQTVPTTYSAAFTFPTIGGNVSIIGGVGTDNFAQIGHVNSLFTTSDITGDIDLPVNGSLTITGGSGARDYALLGHGGQSNAGGDMFTASFDVSANNIVMLRTSFSDPTSFSVIGFVNNGAGTSPITVTSPSGMAIHSNLDLFIGSEIDGVSDAGIGALILSESSASTFSLTSIDITTGGTVALVSPLASVAVDNEFIGILAGAGSGALDISINAGGNINLFAQDLTVASTAVIQNCNPANFTPSANFIDLTSGININTEALAGSSTSIFSSGSINFLAGDTILIGGKVHSETTMLIKAGRSMYVMSTGNIVNVDDNILYIVVDNDNPDPPEIGANDGFILYPGGRVTNFGGRGQIGIYSTTQQLTYIADGTTPSINNSVFRPGPEFVPSQTEKWGIYFNNGTVTTSSPFYTVFYKNNGTPKPPVPPPPPHVITAADERVIYLSNLFISQMLFEQIPPLDDFIYWDLHFRVTYNRKAYKDVKKKLGLRSSFDFIEKEKFSMRREKYFMKEELLPPLDFRNY